MRRPMLNNSNPGDAVYDPFLGSGTTLIAAQTAGRVCYAIEIDPRYVDVAVRRWQPFTGEQATRLADGRPFAEIAARVGAVGQHGPKDSAVNAATMPAAEKAVSGQPGLARSPATRAPAAAETPEKKMSRTSGRASRKEARAKQHSKPEGR